MTTISGSRGSTLAPIAPTIMAGAFAFMHYVKHKIKSTTLHAAKAASWTSHSTMPRMR